jgi:hypothetical protein
MKKINQIKEAVKAKASSEEEYNQLLTLEMMKISNMHNQGNPIPGIIYSKDNKAAKMIELSKSQIKAFKALNLTKSELCFCLLSIIHSLKLTKDDFHNIDLSEFGKRPGSDEDENNDPMI